MEILKTILSVTGISVILAVLIVIAEKFLNNYGECRIDINEGEKELTVEGGVSLLSALASNKIFIPSACGGKATCGTCKVKVTDGAGPLLPTEEPYLSKEERAEGIRLSCQIKIKNNLRIYVPEELFNIREYQATITDITDRTHDIKEFRFKLDEGEDITFKAGQYMQIESEPYGKVKEKAQRAYSISSVPSDKKAFELIIRRVPGGLCTTYMHDHAKVGDKIRVTGPYGDFYMRDDSDEYIFIAGGSGLAPIKSIIMDIIEKGLDKKMIFFFGAVAKRDLYYVEFFKELEEKHHKFKYVPALSNASPDDNWEGETGLVTDVMKRYVDNGNGKHAYLCGSPGMINACIKVLTSMEFNEQLIYYDKF
ncbi:MAG: 2Fe-2S iron-sulfur cluster binding domain-containing protein [Clostridia bacterium]|nr:2Fe-2S iron-sulfur cluster binding domain-containing protein [Clostridia bacterium]